MQESSPPDLFREARPFLRSPQVTKYQPFKRESNEAQVRWLQAVVRPDFETWKRQQRIDSTD